MRWLTFLLGRDRQPPAIPTVDYFFMGAMQDFVRMSGDACQNRPIARLGPHTFARDGRLVIIRYLTGAELAAIRARVWERVFYVIDDMIPIAGSCEELPPEYREKLARFAGETLPGILALGPVVLAPSEPILDFFAPLQREIIAPCALTVSADYSHFDALLSPRSPLRIAFLGTRSHGAGVSVLARIMGHEILRGLDLRLTLFFGRHLPAKLAGLPGLDNRRPLPWTEYRTVLESERFHIVLAPLPDTPFNAGRSLTKVYDTAAVGACGLFSARPPFAGAIAHGQEGLLLPEDAKSWADAIAGVAHDPTSARRMAEACGVRVRDVGDPARLRAFWFDKLGLHS